MNPSPVQAPSDDTPRVRHLIIAYAAPATAWGRIAAPPLDGLARLWTRMQVQSRHDGDGYGLTAPHEQAWADALGLHGQDGHYPWAAHTAGLVDQPCAWITPCHWQLGTDHVTLADPASLRWAPGEAQALHALLAPWFAGDGLELPWQAPSPGATVRWRAHGEPLRNLACASADRAINRHVDRWVQGLDAAPTLKRLQTEIQMLLYDHPFNDARTARGDLPINAFWVSGAGAWDGHGAARADVHMADDLRNAHLAGDVAAWRQAWLALDARWLAPAAAGRDAHSGMTILSLCGERGFVNCGLGANGLRTRLRHLVSGNSAIERSWDLIRSL